MAASAPHQQTEHEREGRTREAWDAYRQSLSDLHGRDYEEAEGTSWSRLQEQLRAIEDDAKD